MCLRLSMPITKNELVEATVAPMTAISFDSMKWLDAICSAGIVLISLIAAIGRQPKHNDSAYFGIEY